jgi:hypothetical protein
MRSCCTKCPAKAARHHMLPFEVANFAQLSGIRARHQDRSALFCLKTWRQGRAPRAAVFGSLVAHRSGMEEASAFIPRFWGSC